jgi:guanosine-3',5'-bis(diphosphate) 3'-pyrophosphohydrolase
MELNVISHVTDEATAIDNVIKQVQSYDPSSDTTLIKTAYIFAREAHCTQRRIEGSPYITHLISVADILAFMRMDSVTIAAGLLHDTIEDTGIISEDISTIFGDEVASLVASLTKLSKLKFKNREQHQAENFRRMLLAVARDVRVILIKFADRLHNMRTLKYLREDKRQRIAIETLEIYSPLANLLGIGWLKCELEDLSFKYLLPDLYQEIEGKVSRKKEEYEDYLSEVKIYLERKFTEGSINATIWGRVKHYYSIYQKIKRQNIPFEQVYDVLGLRITTDTVAHCYSILGILHSCWIPVPGRFKDYIGAPKSNLYQSLHTTVIGPKGEKIEFQIRTEEMERIAEEGIASHWRYKSGPLDAVDDKRFKLLREKIKAYEKTDARIFLANVKSDIFPYHVYVFSPKGDIVELTEGSTVLDYAYYVHTDIGHHCKEGKVDGRIVPLKHVLQNGETVEVITSEEVEPNRDWLRITKTQRARNKIKQWIKQVERQEGINLGIELLQRELKINQIDSDFVFSQEMLEAALSLGFKVHEDMFLAVGFGRIPATKVIAQVLPDSNEQQQEATTPFYKLIRLVTGGLKKPKDTPAIEIKGTEGMMIHRSKCCFPIPHDEIVGFITRGRGISIHRKDCMNLESMTVDNDRLVNVQWNLDVKAFYGVKITVQAKDRLGILAKIATEISSEQINISDINLVRTHKTHACFNFLIDVQDKKQLDKVMKKISSVKGVVIVERVNSAKKSMEA